LPGTDSNVIPLQFPQSDRSPFWGIGTIIPRCQSDGISSFSHIMLHNSVIRGTIASAHFNNSGCTLSIPADFPFSTFLWHFSSRLRKMVQVYIQVLCHGVLIVRTKVMQYSWFRTVEDCFEVFGPALYLVVICLRFLSIGHL
jgi:hypothetical protein